MDNPQTANEIRDHYKANYYASCYQAILDDMESRQLNLDELVAFAATHSKYNVLEAVQAHTTRRENITKSTEALKSARATRQKKQAE